MGAAIVALASAVPAVAGLYSPRVSGLSGDKLGACAISEGKVYCWGYSGGGHSVPPSLKNPRLVSAGTFVNCALDDNGVQCWGDNRFGQTDVPKLKNPTLLAVGLVHVCAFDDDGVHCWGTGRDRKKNLPVLKNPKVLTAGGDGQNGGGYTCAVDDDGLKCWGGGFGVGWSPNDRPTPTLLSTGSGVMTCEILEGKADCWSDFSYNGTEYWNSFPLLKNPRYLATGYEHACALDGNELRCWGHEGLKIRTEAPVLKNVSALAAGEPYTCAQDEEGVSCWLSYSNDLSMSVLRVPVAVKKNAPPSFHLDQSGDLLLWISERSNPARSHFLSPLADFARQRLSSKDHDRELSLARYLLVKLSSPAVLANDAPYFSEKVFPAFQESMKEIESELGIQNFPGVPASPLGREVALRVILSSITVLGDFMSPADRSQLSDVLRALGQSLVDPKNDAALSLAIDAITKNGPAWEKFGTSPKSAFLVSSIQMAAAWLGEK